MISMSIIITHRIAEIAEFLVFMRLLTAVENINTSVNSVARMSEANGR